MSEPLDTAHDVLVAHQRKNIGGCVCGWGVDTGHLGQSHPRHVIDELGRAGLILAKEERLRFWLRKVAVYSNDGWMARDAHNEYVELTGSEPLADWEIELLHDEDGE